MNNPDTPPAPPATAAGFGRGKLLATYVSLAVVGAILWPIQENWRSTPHDSFPLSYYPMFTAKREPVETFYYLVGRDAQGGRHYIPYTMIGVGGLNQVRKQVRRMVLDGRAEEMAGAVAQKVSQRGKTPWSEVIRIEVCRGRYSVDDYFQGRKEPVAEEIKATHPVERSK